MEIGLTNQNLLSIGSSLAIGLLIGLERGWHSREAKEGERIAGIRTYSLIGLLGGLSGFIANHVGGLALGLICFGFTLFLSMAYYVNSKHRDDRSITGLIAILITFLLGAMATMGFIAESASVAIVVALILRFKPQIHGWVNNLERHELHATLELLLISVVLLTILPNENFGPFDAFNPFEIWWLVVLMASISFVGYFAMKIGGPKKGIILTGLFSGFVSSTALTLHFSKLSRERQDLAPLLSLGILLACGVMFFRLLIVMSILNLPLFTYIVGPASLLGCLIVTYALFSWHKKSADFETNEHKMMQNPLALKSALMFGLLLTVVGIAIRAVNHHAGDTGLFTFSVLTGLVDVDAISLSLARMVTDVRQLPSFSFAIILAACSGTLLKGVMAAVIGGRQLFTSVTLPLIGSVLITMVIVYAL